LFTLTIAPGDYVDVLTSAAHHAEVASNIPGGPAAQAFAQTDFTVMFTNISPSAVITLGNMGSAGYDLSVSGSNTAVGTGSAFFEQVIEGLTFRREIHDGVLTGPISFPPSQFPLSPGESFHSHGVLTTGVTVVPEPSNLLLIGFLSGFVLLCPCFRRFEKH